MSQPNLAREVYESLENNTIVKKKKFIFVGTTLRRAKSDLTTITIVVLEHLLAAKLDQQSLFSDDVTLRNIITGINPDTNDSVQNLFIVGTDAMTNMEGQAVFSYSHKRTNAVKKLASTRAVTVDTERGIDSALLFKRFIVVSQSGDLLPRRSDEV